MQFAPPTKVIPGATACTRQSWRPGSWSPTTLRSSGPPSAACAHPAGRAVRDAAVDIGAELARLCSGAASSLSILLCSSTPSNTCFRTTADIVLAISIQTKPSHAAGNDGLPKLLQNYGKLMLASRPRTTELIALPPLWFIIAHSGNWRFLAGIHVTLRRPTPW